MRKLILYSAMSLNGKIARADGSVDWLESIPNPDQRDYGYADFYAGIDTTIQGYTSYQQILDWGIDWPYPDTDNYVLTRKAGLSPTDHVAFISEAPLAFITELKQQPGKAIWLIGGGQVNTLLLNAGLIDELQLFVMPIVLPDGIEVFAGSPLENQFTLLTQKAYSSGVLELHYRSNT